MSDQTVDNVEKKLEEPPTTEELTADEINLDENDPEISQLEFENFNKEEKSGTGKNRIELIMDLILQVSIELGRTKMYVKDILELERGSIIELDKMAGEPVDLYINEKKMAVGEVVVVDKHFGVRITNLIDPQDRIKNLGKDL
jgi:flagellar motor switch protein FliN/FliY